MVIDFDLTFQVAMNLRTNPQLLSQLPKGVDLKLLITPKRERRPKVHRSQKMKMTVMVKMIMTNTVITAMKWPMGKPIIKTHEAGRHLAEVGVRVLKKHQQGEGGDALLLQIKVHNQLSRRLVKEEGHANCKFARSQFDSRNFVPRAEKVCLITHWLLYLHFSQKKIYHFKSDYFLQLGFAVYAPEI